MTAYYIQRAGTQVKIATFLLLALVSVEARAVERATYEAVCMNHLQLAEITNTFGEIPVARGVSVPLGKKDTVFTTVIFVNPQTNTFTIVEQVTDDRYCVIVLGTEFQPASAKIQKDFQNKNDKRKL
jgi:succinyl-CoA synthetase alpha subunit